MVLSRKRIARVTLKNKHYVDHVAIFYRKAKLIDGVGVEKTSTLILLSPTDLSYNR